MALISNSNFKNGMRRKLFSPTLRISFLDFERCKLYHAKNLRHFPCSEVVFGKIFISNGLALPSGAEKK